MQVSRREIVYPFFLHCCRETEDIFWKYIFEDLAYGKAPYGAYFSKGFFCCSFKGKEFSYKVDPNRPTLCLYKDIRALLHSRVGIQSPEDMRNQRKRFEEKGAEVCLSKCDDWGAVKRKEVRNLLIESFALSYAAERGWAKTKTRRFLSALLLAIQLKAIQNDDIHLTNGRITRIECIDKIEKVDIASWDYSWRMKSEAPAPRRLVTSG